MKIRNVSALKCLDHEVGMICLIYLICLKLGRRVRVGVASRNIHRKSQGRDLPEDIFMTRQYNNLGFYSPHAARTCSQLVELSLCFGKCKLVSLSVSVCLSVHMTYIFELFSMVDT